MQGSPRIDELRQKFHENPRRYFAPLANEYRKAGDPEQAIAICRAHLAQQPGHMSGHVVYGQALFDAQRMDEARTVFEKALSLDPDNPIVLRKLGDIARQRGDATEAKHWYGRALDTDPHDTEVAAYIAELTEPLSEPEIEPAMESEVGVEAAAESTSDLQSEVDAVAEPGAADLAAESQVESEEGPESLVEAGTGPESQGEADAGQDSRAETHSATEADEDAGSPRLDEVIPVVPAHDDVAWRNTPAHEDSPFVTRTMAELYAKQGFREAALDVYRQLALNNPDDEEIVARIGELSEDRGAAVDDQAPRAHSLPDIEADLLSWGDLASDVISSDAISSPSAEEVETLPKEEREAPDVPVPGDEHFTEMELSGGDSWDTDMWGAGFSSEESVPLEFSSHDAPGQPSEVLVPAEDADEPAAQPAIVADVEPLPMVEEAPREPAQDAEQEPASNAMPAVGEEEVAAEAVAEEVAAAEVASEEVTSEEAASEEAASEEVASAEVASEAVASAEVVDADDGAHLVAYSPQPPDASELAHYTPQGPTIREFFAAIASRRPPSQPAAQSFTARAAVPMPDSGSDSLPGDRSAAPSGVEPARESGEPAFPLAGDAFSELFPQSDVSEEDSRAAFALSGAVSGSVPGALQPTAPPPRAPVDPQLASPLEQGQESEEDIRRFREWLDGLAGA